ncbi:O-linked N-acetylglucosamine transferase family protein [Trichothermofontia sp.]
MAPDNLSVLSASTPLPTLTQARRYWVERWLALPEAQLREAYETEFRQALLSLRSTNLRYFPLAEAEQDYVRQLEQRLQETRSLQILLALTPYQFAYQSPVDILRGFPIPGWLLTDLLDYLLEPIAFFREVEGADRYAAFMLTLTRSLLTQVSQNPESPVWQDVAQRFVQQAHFLPCWINHRNLKALYQQRSRLFEVVLQAEGGALDYTFPDRPQRDWLKVGILTTYLLPSLETITTLPIFEYLDHSQFYVTIYTFSSDGNEIERYCRTRCDRFVVLPGDTVQAAARVRQDDLDILLISTNVTHTGSAATRLAHYRLARIQVACGNVPVSTGMRHMDYYLMGSQDITPNSQGHHSETLVCLPEITTACYHIEAFGQGLATEYPTRQDWGATEQTVVFISGATLYTITPEVLHTWAALLDRVPDSMLVIYVFTLNLSENYPKEGFVTLAHAILRQHQVDPQRLIFLDNDTVLNPENVKAYLRLADIYLEAFPMTTPLAVLDALAVGVPVVTLVGETLRGNRTAGLLRALQLEDWITPTLGDYFDRALHLATDADFRYRQHRQLREKMAEWPSFLDRELFAQKVGQALKSLFETWLAQQATPASAAASTAAAASMPSLGFGATPTKASRKSSSRATNLSWVVAAADPQLKQGIAQLLQGEREQAQATWDTAIAQAATPAEQNQRKQALVALLHDAAEHQQKQQAWSQAVSLRRQIWQLAPQDGLNQLRLIECLVREKTFSVSVIDELGIIDTLTPEVIQTYNPDHLMGLLNYVWEADASHEAVLAFTTACLRCLPNPERYAAVIELLTAKLKATIARPDMAIALADRYLEIVPEQPDLLRALVDHCIGSHQFRRGVALARRYDQLATTPSGKLFANYNRLQGLLSIGGHWAEAYDLIQRQKSLLAQVLQLKPAEVEKSDPGLAILSNSLFFFPYFDDRPAENLPLRHQAMQLLQAAAVGQPTVRKSPSATTRAPASRNTPALPDRPLRKIGYISHYFVNHSVGWLARWLIEHHDRRRFELYGYFVNYREKSDYLQAWYTDKFTHARRLGLATGPIIEQIRQDDIDILIDLDSLTVNQTCRVLAHKVAPIQVSWLGWDAPALPAVDYFIADPYVLPEEAQAYYPETIWRLPQTYIAVDGFELGIPSLRRDKLGIPSDAVIYYTGQAGFKWNLETLQLQLQIIREVPNSYFLIKGLAKETAIQEVFRDLAEAASVKPERLRFLPNAPTESIHRANLQIADVVLDTYPYNGATTTLETLWVGVPLVTRVGQQFQARNSYTMLMNAGIEEGIAWTAEEYVAWGIRYGKDADLRRLVRDKLRRSRQTAPLWHAAQFTREMEKAYLQMWAIKSGQIKGGQ